MAKDEAEAGGGKAGGDKAGGVVAAALLLTVTGGGAFALVTLAGGEPAAPCEAAARTGEDGHAEAPEPAGYVSLEPIAVSLAPGAGARTLRIGIALGLTGDAHHLEEADVLRLKDGFLDALRRAKAADIADPDALPALRADLLAEARGVLGEGVVATLLITDFLMR